MNQPPNIDPSILKNAKDIVCTCGSAVYDAAFVFKFISAIISPSGQAMVAPEQVFVCKKCGELLSIESTKEERAGVIPKDNDKPQLGLSSNSSSEPDSQSDASSKPVIEDDSGNGTPKGTKLGIVSPPNN
jgi:hypothetical protein